MRIYFEDEELKKISPDPNIFLIDANSGVSSNITMLNKYKNKEASGEIVIIYTNSILAFSNQYAWNKELEVPEIYIRSGENETFTRIDKLTNRKLKERHNLAKLYISGEFNKN